MSHAAQDFIRQSRILTFMEEHGYEVSELLRNLYIQTLISVRHVERVKDEINVLKKQGMTLHPPSYTMLCELYLQLADLDALMSLVDEMEVAYPKASARTCMRILMKAIEVEHLPAVQKLWDIVVNRYDVNVGIGLATMVLHCAARIGDPAFARTLMAKLHELNAQLTEEHFVLFIEACVRGGEVAAALKSLCLVNRTASPKLKYLDLLSQAIAEDSTAVDKAFYTLQEIRDGGEAQVNTAAVNVIIQAAVLLQDIKRAISTYNDMSIFSCVPNSDTYESLLLLCLNENQPELATKFLTEMTELGLQKTKRIYDRLIRLYLKSQDYERAFPVLEEMKIAGHQPSESLYEAVILKCAEESDGRAAVAAQEMREANYYDGRIDTMISRPDVSVDPNSIPYFSK